MCSWEIEEGDKGAKVVFAQALIDGFVDPRKEEGVEGLGEIVAVIRRAVRIEEDGTELLLEELGLVRKDGFERPRLNAEEIGYNGEHIGVAYDGSVFVPTTVAGKFQVSKMEDGCDELAGLRDVALGHADALEGMLELLES